MTTSDDHRHHLAPVADRQANLDEIFRAKNVRPIQSADDLACDGIFESNAELDEFIAYTYEARRTEFA